MPQQIIIDLGDQPKLTFNGEEEWANIKGFPRYEVSTFARVRNKKTETFMTPSWKGGRSGGYQAVTLSRYNKPARNPYVHILVAEAFVPKPETDKELIVHHKDDKKDKNGFLNNCASNLQWVTRSEHGRLTHSGVVEETIASAGISS